LVENHFDVVVLFAGVAVSDVSGDYLNLTLDHGGVQVFVNVALDVFAIELLHDSSFSLTS
jgi:molybdopterin biosynthesis enzyme